MDRPRFKDVPYTTHPQQKPSRAHDRVPAAVYKSSSGEDEAGAAEVVPGGARRAAISIPLQLRRETTSSRYVIVGTPEAIIAPAEQVKVVF